MMNWQGVQPEIIKKLQNYCSELVQINKEQLISVNLIKDVDFGETKKMPIKLVVIMRDIGINILKQNLKLIKSGIKKGVPAPLFFTLKHMESSADVFPVEFYEMKEQHIVIYGEDLLDRIEVDDTNLRLQCEQEIKGKLIRLRQVYLEVGLSEKEIKRLVYASFESFIPVFRAMLKLKKVAVPEDALGLLQEFSKVYNVDMELFNRVYSLEVDGLKKEVLEDFLGSYIDLVRDIAVVVDAMAV